MNLTDEQIANFAWQEFCKYGLSKTTMSDIANSAGISRQSLYNRFQNKDELLRLVARLYFKKNLVRCSEALQKKSKLEDILDTLIQFFIIEVWETVKSLPEGDVLEQSPHEIISEEVQVATNEKITLISDVLIKYLNNKAIQKDTANDIAKYFCASASGIKSLAKDEAELLQLSKTLKLSLESFVLMHAN
jgi:AcrR family transcriptional regulator